MARVMKRLLKEIKPGVSADNLDKLAFSLIKECGGRPSFLNYKPDFASKLFPCTLCVSVNEVIVHGIPKAGFILKEGDIVSLDLGMEYKGFYTDMAVTAGVGKISSSNKKLIRVTRQTLAIALKTAKRGNTLGDIGFAISNYILKNGFAVIKDLVGHGVGYSPHEDPVVLNYGKQKEGLKLGAGMVLAIEPMITFKSGAIKENSDGSFSTLNGCNSCHFEHTIAILKNKTIILTK